MTYVIKSRYAIQFVIIFAGMIAFCLLWQCGRGTGNVILIGCDGRKFVNLQLMDLHEIVGLYADVDSADVEALSAACETALYAKGALIVTQGCVDENLYLVRSGIFRVSCDLDGTEDTICFGHDGDAFMSFHSFYVREAAPFSCVAVLPVEAYRIGFARLETLLRERPGLMAWFNRMLVEELYLLERRYVYFGAKDAYSRFSTFVAARPDILRHVPAKYIAQYLKIRQETLYRIRARYLRESE